MRILIAKSALETKKVAARLARSISAPAVIALEGNLGAGKTTFVQGFARALGIKGKVQSPTFVLMKIYPLKHIKRLKRIAHIDCYRLNSPKDLLRLGFKNLLRDKDALILIEWADKIKRLLPKRTLRVELKHGKKFNERIINIS